MARKARTPTKSGRAQQRIWGRLGEPVTVRIDGHPDRDVTAIPATLDTEEVGGGTAQRVEGIPGIAIRRVDLPDGLPVGAEIVRGRESWRVDSVTGEYGDDVRAVVVRSP